MLIQFTVGNTRSFKDKYTLSLEAAVGKEFEENAFKASDNLLLLKSAVIYGANASGKSNLFNAFAFMRNFIINSFNAQIISKILVEPFKLSTLSEDKPSHFEVVFIYEGIRYRYGFETSSEKVFAEWLFNYPKGKETKLFTREGSSFDINKLKFSEGKQDLTLRTRQNALFLSVLAQFNGEISNKILNWFNLVNVLSGVNQQAYMNITFQKLKDEAFKSEILKFIKSADIDIEDFFTEPLNITPDNLPPFLTEEARKQIAQQSSLALKINTVHKKYNKENKIDSLVPFDLTFNESAGTNKLFFLSAPILNTLSTGKILIVDEMDAQLHPLIMESLIKLFHSKETNPKNAQLIFNAHSTLPLCNKYFRRDQIWFVQKDQHGASQLYSLDDYSVRKDSSYEKDYLLGRYGGIPIVNIYDTKKKK